MQSFRNHAGVRATLVCLMLLMARQAQAEGAEGAQGAGAQAPDTPGDKPAAGTLPTIVVTARRTRENLQDVPTAVTAITASTLEDLRIDSFETVAQTVPNVYIQRQAGAPTSAQMQIRGISNGSLNEQVDSGIGLYVDGVYFGRAGAAAFEMADLERVEVLRGPQGTLFGRNATGGAINLVTASPTGRLDGKVDLGLGNYRDRSAKATIDTPSFSGLAARLTVAHAQVDGAQRNTAAVQTFQFTGDYTVPLTTNRRGGDSNSDMALLALAYKGSGHASGLKLDYKYDLTNARGTMDYRRSGDLSGPGGTPAGFTYQDALFMPLDGTYSQRVRGQSLVAEYAFRPGLTLKYIYGTRRYTIDTPGNQVLGDRFTYNADMGPDPTGSILTFGILSLRTEYHRQASHELQLIGSTGPVDWLLGAFTIEENGGVNNPDLLDLSGKGTGVLIGPVNTISVAAGSYLIGQNLTVNNKSSALMAHASWKLGETWVLGGGLRRSEDRRTEDIINAGLLAKVSNSYSGGHTDFDVSSTYRFNADTNSYLKYSTGYVSGGVLHGVSFSPEEMKATELGLKTTSADRRLRVNAALFEQRRIDGQIEYFGATGYSMGKADSRTAGLELEVNYATTRQLSLNAALGLTTSSSAGDVFITQPKETVYVGAEYAFNSFMGSSPVLRLDLNWRPGYYTIKCPAGQTQDPGKDTCSGTIDVALNDAARLKSATNIDARMSFNEIHLGAAAVGRMSLWVRNLLDNRNVEYDFSLGSTSLASTFQRPRSYGLDFSAEF